MGRCTALKRNGDPCTLPSVGKIGVCWAHDPANAEQRRRRASRGGKSTKRPGAGSALLLARVEAITARAEELAELVLLEGAAIDKDRAAVANQFLNTALRGISTRLKVTEQTEIVRRVEELEELLQAKKEGGERRWGS